MTYQISKRINNTFIPPTMYDDAGRDFDELNIVKKNGKFGMLLKDSNHVKTILDFDYDNISMAGFSLYLLVKNGKMGLAHIKRIDTASNETNFKLLKIIPCEYDVITFPTNGESFVLMRKDSEKSSCLQIYFVKTRNVSDTFWRKEYIDRDYIAVTDIQKSKVLIFDKRGLLLHSFGAPCSCHAFESKSGTVFLTSNFNGTRDLLIFKKKLKPGFENETDDYYYVLTGEKKIFECGNVVKPIFAPKIIRTYERNSILGFLIKRHNRFCYMDGNLEIVKEVNANHFFVSSCINSGLSENISNCKTKIDGDLNED